MDPGRTFGDRLMTGTGLFCLMASLLLGSPGVRAVRAEDAPEVGPVGGRGLEVPVEGAAPTAPAVPPTSDPGLARKPAAGDVIVLNSRGYNYGPRTSPPTEVRPPLAPAVESSTR
jgi:hypothetical protein